MTRRLDAIVRAERRRHRTRLRQAAGCALVVGSASVLLLGLSGWFLTAAALAGGAGPLAAQAFNYMLPGAGIRLLAILRTGARYGERWTSHAAALRALAQVRERLFRALAGSLAGRALLVPLGELSARIVQDVAAIEARFVRLSAPWNTFGGIGAAAALLVLGGWQAAAATVVVAFALLVFGRWLSRRAERYGRRVQRSAGALKDALATMTAASAELRCYGREGWAREVLAARSRDLADAQLRQSRAIGWIDFAQPLALGLAAIAALVLARHAGAPIAALCALAAAMVIDGLGPQLRHFGAEGALREAEARLEDILAEERPRAAHARRIAGDPITLLDGGPLRIGDRVALTGRSGAGKTTLVEMLIGLRRPIRGRVRIDGIDIADLAPATLRCLFAWSPQDAQLLAGTVRDNLLLARHDATDDELWKALRHAALEARIAALPRCLDGWVGENGTALSGGERRRLSLARAFLAPSPWLVLDEPTEGLDASTETRVVRGIAHRLAMTGQGLILVGHRPAPRALCAVSLAVDGQQELVDALL